MEGTKKRRRREEKHGTWSEGNGQRREHEWMTEIT
jgi:hypothetical protein